MMIEVFTTVRSNGILNFTRIYRTKRDRPPVPIEDVLEKISKYHFTFQNPIDLHKLFEDPDPASVEICNNMKRLRLDLLYPLSDMSLTEEAMTQITSNRPNIAPVMTN
ncbi:hypothetical protein BBP40_006192 [Aspergillus hancockii]|nr:hypothetical protein BBP40_006192 [Aspergillus hancockii]